MSLSSITRPYMKWLAASLMTLVVGLVCVLPGRELAAQGAVAKVTDVRVGQHGERIRVVLDLDRGIDFDVFTLPEPYRVVVNLPEIDWAFDQHHLPKDKGLLSRMRYGLFSPGTSRMVLDVNGPVSVEKSFVLKPIDGKHWRFVMDLAPTTETVFLEALAAQRAKARKSLDELVASTTATTPEAAPQVVEPPAGTSSASLPPRKPSVPGKYIIAIDAGHGGVDPGTISRSGRYEKTITLAMARNLRDALEATGRYKVVMTRDRDIFLRLRDRVTVARKAGADLFLSIHVNSASSSKARGLSVYTLSERASDKEAAKLAAKENKADLIAGIDLSTESSDVTNILLDLAQRETMNQSSIFAQNLVSELRREIKMLRNSHRFAGFAVLKAPDMPSVLVELGFFSNKQDERNLVSESYRKKMAQGMVRGIDQHFKGVQEARIY